MSAPPTILSELDLSTVRLAESLFAAPPGASGRVLLLDNTLGRYSTVPALAFLALVGLSDAERGMTVRELEQAFPAVDILQLHRLGLIVVIPPTGFPVPHKVVAEFAAQNLIERLRFSLGGWPVVAREMQQSEGNVQTARPLVLDELEAAARTAFAVPGTDRLCTVVALTFVRMLRRRRLPGRVVISSTSDQPYIHAYVSCFGHRCDPSDDIVETPPLRGPSSWVSG